MIVHLDADAFFVSVEQAADAKLRGKAVAVGGQKRGIIASASYEARKLGIYTPMPTARARRLCPKLIILPGNFELYERFSRFMFTYAFDFTPAVEITSIDEGYFDLGGYRKHPPLEVAGTIKKAIGQSLKVSVSEGVASNKLVSQVASKLKKPASLIEVPQGEERSFLAPLANHWLPGVGPKLSSTLNAAGLALIHQIAATPVDLLALLAGSRAAQLREFASGVDPRPLVLDQPEAKSYGTEETFGEDQTSEGVVLVHLQRMADQLTASVREDGRSFRTVTLKLRYNDMQETSRSLSLEEPGDLAEDIFPLLRPLLKRAWERRVSLRMVSLKLSGIYGSVFRSGLPLEPDAMKKLKMQRLAPVVDLLRREQRIMRGSELWLKHRRTREHTAPVPRLPAAPEVWTQTQPRTLPPGLNFKSHFSFLDSTLSIPAIIKAAQACGLPSVALTDPNLHGAVPFFKAAKEAGLRPVIAAELRCDGRSLLAFVKDRTGHANLCRLLSLEHLTRDKLHDCREGLRFIAPDDARFALPEVRYLKAADRRRYDIVQSIRTLTLLNQRHRDKRSGAFHLAAPHEWAQRFTPAQIEATQRLSEECTFAFETDTLRFPRYIPSDASTPHAFLRRLTMEGCVKRYGAKAHERRAQLEEELGIIAEVGYEEYFLAVWELLQECRTLGIEWITRGSAADSLVCYCLGISGVCPIRFDLYFRRFLNRERMALKKLPDIDIDFPHDRRDEVVDMIFRRYGSLHAACVGGFSTFQGRSAFAEIAKVLGVSEHQIRRYTERVPHSSPSEVQDAVEHSQECRDAVWQEEPYRTALGMAAFLDGFPRYPKMHPCGVVISRDAIHSLTPTFMSAKGLPTTHFDMDAVEAVGLVKMDILAQGGLSVMRDAAVSLRTRSVPVDLEALEPWQDAQVWEMIASGNARAVHHIESPAMTSLCRMTNVREMDGLVAIVSVIRPGAANEQKKRRFTLRYQGLEPVTYPHPSLEPCLRSTFGLVVYEEHILQICEAFAGLPPGRADVLRRALNKHNERLIEEIKVEFFAAAAARGHTEEKTEEVWQLVCGFRGYAFCRAHSTAYAVEAYQAAWLKRYHPAEFMAGVLTNGKGFYSPLVYVLECHRLGITLLPPTVDQARAAYTVEDGRIRVPLARMKGLTEATGGRMLQERERSPFASIADFCARVRPQVDEIEGMIRVGAFDAFNVPRSRQFWQARSALASSTINGQGWLLPPPDTTERLQMPLHEPSPLERLEAESDLYGFTISGHPLDLYPHVAWESYCPVSRLHEFIGQRVVSCGLVVEQRLHQQSTGELMKFLTLADKTGMVETELFASTYRSYGTATIRYPVLEVEATVEGFDNGRGFTLRVHRVGKPRNVLTSPRSQNSPR